MSVDVLFVDDIGVDLINVRLRRAVAGSSLPDCTPGFANRWNFKEKFSVLLEFALPPQYNASIAKPMHEKSFI